MIGSVKDLQRIVASFEGSLGAVNHPEMRDEGWSGFADLQLLGYVSSQKMTPPEFSYAFKHTARIFNRIGASIRNPKAFFYVNFKTTCEKRVERIVNGQVDEAEEEEEDARALVVLPAPPSARVYAPPPPRRFRPLVSPSISSPAPPSRRPRPQPTRKTPRCARPTRRRAGCWPATWTPSPTPAPSARAGSCWRPRPRSPAS